MSLLMSGVLKPQSTSAVCLSEPKTRPARDRAPTSSSSSTRQTCKPSAACRTEFQKTDGLPRRRPCRRHASPLASEVSGLSGSEAGSQPQAEEERERQKHGRGGFQIYTRTIRPPRPPCCRHQEQHQ